MTIDRYNLKQAISALKECAEQNKHRERYTGTIFVSDLCNDVANYLSEVRRRNVEEDLANDICPDCGNSLVFSDGCKHCTNCGFAACDN